MSNESLAKPQSREHWAGSIGFILAASGSAIGLGNIWKFPYVVGENGGGAFILIYLACILVIGFPVMLCSIAIGRKTQRSPISAFRALTPKNRFLSHLIGAGMIIAAVVLFVFQSYGYAVIFLVAGGLTFKYSWQLAGMLGVLAAFLILGFYGAVGGWIVNYCYCLFADIFSAPGTSPFAGAAETTAVFNEVAHGLRSNGARGIPWQALGGQIAFMTVTALIVYAGVRKGIERYSKFLTPMLFIIIGFLILRGLTLPGAVEGVRHFLAPNFSALSGTSILMAMGQAFFSLSLGMGIMITYGSYAPKQTNILRVAGWTVVLDTVIALLACFAIFPFVFAMEMEPDAGPKLIFEVLPQVFHRMGDTGPLWGTLFFLFILIAALTSAISILEVVTSALMDELKLQRHAAVLCAAIPITIVGAFTVVSAHDWQNIEWLHRGLQWLYAVDSPNFFAWCDHVTSNWILPISGLLISIFTGWIWTTRHAGAELRNGANGFLDIPLVHLLAGTRPPVFRRGESRGITLLVLWGFLIRFVSPAAIVFIILYQAGWIT